MPEEFSILIYLALGLGLVYAMWIFFSVCFQSLLFQRYRLQKNEAAMRKTKLHDESIKEANYRERLLGSVEEKTD